MRYRPETIPPIKLRQLGFYFALLVAWASDAAAAKPFDFSVVAERARQLAAEDYQPPPAAPQVMRELGYDEFQRIRSDPDKALWRDYGSRFELMPMITGLYFKHAVKLNVVTPQGVQALPFSRDYFKVDSADLAKKVPADAGFAGFKLTYPLNKPSVQDQFMVFAGASYFRAVGKGDGFGLSARGLAVDTGEASGEEFPNFVEYWLVKPPAGADRFRLYALLDGKRVTGAYEFTIHPGKPTRVDVRSMLFPRKKIGMLGVAPLTSMFFYGENTPRPPGEWRPEVHDSDGLQILGGSGEWLWNPLHNPMRLHTQAFTVDDPKGFGLIQRDRAFGHYQDPEAQYQQRPSAWVIPQGKWEPGRVVLVKIPTDSETNDNIVAFWSPLAPVEEGRPLRFDYRLLFGDSDIAGGDVGRSVASYVGRGDVIGGGDKPGTYRVVVDFRGGGLDQLAPGTKVAVDATAQEGGELLERQVRYVPESRVWRVSLLARPAEKKPLALRVALRGEQGAMSETWTYTLPVPNAIVGESK